MTSANAPEKKQAAKEDLGPPAFLEHLLVGA